MKRALPVLLAAILGCGNEAAVPDAEEAADLARPVGDRDLAAPASDLAAARSDLAVTADFAEASGDLARGPADLGVVADLSPPPAGDLAGPAADLASPGGFTTVFTILLENHDYKEIVGSPNAPYLNSLISDYGLAINYKDSGTHPSLPNYLYLVSGETQYGGLFDCDPAAFCLPKLGNFPVDKDNLGHQLEVAGITWRSYQESMGAPCKLTAAGAYAPKHDPFLYFTNIQKGANQLCAARNVDYGQFANDLAAGTFRYMWITPNLNNDGHDPAADPVKALKQSDAWCKSEIPKILASPIYQAGGVIFLTWDEAEGRNGNSSDQVPMIVISPRLKAKGVTSNTALNHASYLATVEDLFKLPRLGAAKGAKTLLEFFP